jgi:MFS family permease
VRVLQAVGASVAYPSAMAIIRTVSGKDGLDPSSALSGIATANMAGAAVGPLVGGLGVHLYGWEALFWLNVPLALLAGSWVMVRIPSTGAALIDGSPVSSGNGPGRFDVIGMALFAVTTVALFLTVITVPVEPQWWLLVVAAAAGVGMMWWDRRTPRSFLGLTALISENRALVGVFVHFWAYNAVFYGGLYGIPMWLEHVRGTEPFQVGLVMLPLAAVGSLATPLADRLMRRTGVRSTLIVGGVIAVAAAGSLALFRDTAPIALVLLSCALFGLSYALTNLGLQSRMYLLARADRAGAAAGLYQTARFLGGIVSASVIAMAYADGIRSSGIGVLGLCFGAVAVVLVVCVIAVREPSPTDRRSRRDNERNVTP